MGVEHYMVCDKCKQYIDLHKAYWLSQTINNYRPPLWETVNKEDAPFQKYWNGRALWFLWHHKNHGESIKMWFDTSDEWWSICYELEEVFRSELDMVGEPKE